MRLSSSGLMKGNEDGAQPPAGSSIVRKGSWLRGAGESRGARPGRQRSLKKGLAFQRVPSIPSIRGSKRKNKKKVAGAEKARGDADESRREPGVEDARKQEAEESQWGPGTRGAQIRADEEKTGKEKVFNDPEDDEDESLDDDDERALNPPGSSSIHNDRALHSTLDPFEKAFINQTMSRLQSTEPDMIDVHFLGRLLRDICALERPFRYEYHDDEIPARNDSLWHAGAGGGRNVSVDIEPFWISLVHMLSGWCEEGGDGVDAAMVTGQALLLTWQLKRVIRGVLNDMNVKVIRSDHTLAASAAGEKRGNVRPKKTSEDSWSSLSNWNCGLYCL